LGNIAAMDESNLRGYRKLYRQHVQQAHEGCDFDFLRYRDE